MDPVLQTTQVAFKLLKELDIIRKDKHLVLVNAHALALLEGFGELTYVHTSFPMYESLRKAGRKVVTSIPENAEQILIIGDRVRELNRKRMLQAAGGLGSDGLIMMAVANEFGSKSVKSDFGKVFELQDGDSKGHCRIFWGKRDKNPVDHEWADLLEPVKVEGADLYSNVGNFSYRSADKGSLLLAQNLPELSGKVADFGAAYGLLCKSILESEKVTSLVAIESDKDAVEAGQANFTDSRLQYVWGDVLSDSCLKQALGSSGKGGLDYVVMNPPFHRHGQESLELGKRFFEQSFSVIKPGGTLIWVANKHIPYARLMGFKKNRYRVLATDNQFLVGSYTC